MYHVTNDVKSFVSGQQNELNIISLKIFAGLCLFSMHDAETEATFVERLTAVPIILDPPTLKS